MDIQSTNGEDRAQRSLPPLADLQLPHDAHGEEQDREIHDHVWHRGADQIRGKVDVMGTLWQVLEVRRPEQFRRRGLKDCGEEDGDAPGDDEREHDKDGFAERGPHAEESQVEHEDGAFDRRHQRPVQDLDAVDNLREHHLIPFGYDCLMFPGAVVRGDEVESRGTEREDEADDDEAVVPPEVRGGEPARDEAQEDGEDGDDEGDDVDGDDLEGFAVVEVAWGHCACRGSGPCLWPNTIIIRCC